MSGPLSPHEVEAIATMLERHHAYVREHLEDMAEVRDWTWTSSA